MPGKRLRSRLSMLSDLFSHHQPAPNCDNRPDRLDQTKRPSSLKKTVGRTESARTGEQQNEPMALAFEQTSIAETAKRPKSVSASIDWAT